MLPSKSKVLIPLVLAAACIGAQAQTTGRGRIREAVDETRRVRLAGQVHPLAQSQYDRGAAPAGLAMDHMLLLLKRSPEQQDALAKLLEDLHDAASPEYHQWLTPDEFGRRFGVADSDLQTVTSWLSANGFHIDSVAKARNFIEFSGSAAAVRRAFATDIRRYVVRGNSHWANSAVPSIPAALAPVVEGFASLHNFHSAPQITAASGPAPQTNFGGGTHALSPSDYATIYNIRPLYQSSINGSGSTIAVLGRTNINVQDIADFRNFFGLPANAPQVVVNGSDPGIVSTGEQMEAVLDTTWAGAVAPNATVKLIVSASTNTTDGVFLSEKYVIDNNLADIMTESFGACEAQNTGAASTISTMAQQAAAQGITFLVSTGDSGSAGCDDPNTATTARYGASVNLMASTPYTVAVGGTQFNDTANPAQYWSASNGSGYVSVLSYIPESVWNQSCSGCSSPSIWAGGGGASVLFGKPSWQTGVAGIPADGHRDVPDVSLTASSHDPYIVCMSGSCKNNQFYMVSGTSASAPSFAGIMALARQRAGARLGLVNPVLYRLAATQPAAFNDVTLGTNAVPGASGYSAGSGYDLATGLGSVNAANLVNAWSGSTPTVSATTTTLSISPTAIAAGGSASVTVRVTPRSGSGVPTGSVALITSTGATVASLPLSGGAAVANVGNWPSGAYSVTGRYSGDSSFSASDSTSVSVTVGSATASLSATSVAFGSVNVGAAASQNVTLTNSGAVSLTGVAVGISGTDFSQTNNCPATLGGGANCTITVTFRPSAGAARTGSLTVAGLTASLSGTGIVAGPTLTPASVTFGTVNAGSTSASQTLTLTNPSAVALSGITVTFGGSNPGDFAGTTTCGSTLAANSSCTIAVSFKPTTAGARSATVTAANITASLTGTGASSTTPSGSYTLQAPATATTFTTMVVNWTAPAGHATNDFIGLYSAAGGYWFQQTGTATSGSFTVAVPSSPGTYFFRYVLGNTWTVAAQSSNITVQYPN